MNVAGISSSLSASGDLSQFDRVVKPKAEQAKTAAAQFEAILVRQFLNESVGSLTGKSDSAGSGVYGYFLTDTLAQNITTHGGLGLGKVIEQQLLPRPSLSAAHPSK
jgi:Rod binding domain-containing protein